MEFHKGKIFVDVVKDKFATDLFTVARLKIVFLYLLMGVIVLGAAEYIEYAHGWNAVAVGSGLVVMLVLASLFAGITLRPIKRAMEKQKRFISNVSHELKTPISVMKTSSEVALLEADDLTHDELVAVLKSNLEEIDQMSKITQVLLHLSTMNNDRIAKFEMSPVDLTSIADRVVRSVLPLAAEKQIELASSVEKDLVVQGNATALEEMILNLAKNAVAYTPPGGTIHVNLWKRASGTNVSVEDTGIGITEKDLPNIFEPFYRGSNATNYPKKANAGLGLAIVKEIAAVHHATISVKSEIGHGTTFRIKFPAKTQFREKFRR
jgi:signal transduction histidine kinase